MGQLSRFLRNVQGPAVAFWCAGCRQAHTIGVGPGGWTWNGDVEKPVFSPSILVTGRAFTAAGQAAFDAWHAAGLPKPAPAFEAADTRCHSFVGCNGAQPGEIVYLSDCTHDLAGRTVPMAEWPGVGVPSGVSFT